MYFSTLECGNLSGMPANWSNDLIYLGTLSFATMTSGQFRSGTYLPKKLLVLLRCLGIALSTLVVYILYR